MKTAQQPYNLGFVRLAEFAACLKGPCPLKTGQPGSEVQLEVGLGCLWRGRETSYEQAKLRTGGAVACRLQPFRYAYRPREDDRVRRRDVRRVGGLWVIHITPDAGTQKANEARGVVLHPQLVELGSPMFVEASAEGR